MRLLELESNGELSLTKDLINNIPSYAILSHTWGDDDEEVTFKDLTERAGETKAGYRKIRFCGEQAARNNLRYFWVDTCCIDKSNNTELSEAINSMFRWYRDATKCYVYLEDVSTNRHDQIDTPSHVWEPAFRRSRWFTRGWTLQELIAPPSVEFFSLEGKLLGDKMSLERQVHEITGIAIQVLQGNALSKSSVAERMSWAETRNTTREEDKAYSLLGIFDISMPLIYGEGVKSAFRRLQVEISALGNDPLNRLPYVAEAPFNSYQRQTEPTCLPNTRIDLLQEIYDWADGQDERCIFWLNGLAGTGKSTIPRTIARRYFEQERLGASFFFSRGVGDASHAGKFVTSIAVQLGSSITPLYWHICQAVAEHTNIASQSLRDQWHQLVLNPLSKLNKNIFRPSYLLVIDALDECDNDSNVRIILQLLAETQSLEKVRLRIFLTSRPEISVRYGFRNIPDAQREEFVLHSISPSTINHDIFAFLEYNIRVIGEEDAQEPDWPGLETIQLLVRLANGLFIWAATACRFIRGGPWADERLRMLLEGSNTAGTVEEYLNGIYITVLQNSIQQSYTEQERQKLYGMLREHLGSIVILFSPLSIEATSRLLHTTKQLVERTLRSLHAILDIPKDSTRPLRLHHPSFRDFLLDSNRCKDANFQVDEKLTHRALAANCIQLMSESVKQDICGLGTPGAVVADVASSQINQCLPPEVQYACIYWVQHVQKSGMQLYDNDEVHQFLQEHLLHWLEALGWMQKVSEGFYAIESLESIVTVYKCPRLSELVHDIGGFVRYNRSSIEQAPIQTYYSALVFAPAMSVVKKLFQDRIPRWMQRQPEVEEHWDALFETRERRFDLLPKVAFSMDGEVLASTANDYGNAAFRLWDSRSGAELQGFRHIFAPVRAMAFSPDGKVLALGSQRGDVSLRDASSGAVLKDLASYWYSVWAMAFSPDSKVLAWTLSIGAVMLWEVGSGAEPQSLGYHLDSVCAVAFSPNSKVLASASFDKTVKLWNAESNIELRTLKGHTGGANAVAFSPDGNVLATSDDNRVRLWDVGSGTTLQTLKNHKSKVYDVAFSPDGNVLAAAHFNRVRLWDAGSGSALQTLNVGVHLRNLSFSHDGTFLQTNRGLLHISSPSCGAAGSSSNDSSAIFVREQWVTWGMENMLRLPYDYAFCNVAVHGSMVAVACRSDRVKILKFNFESP